MALEIRWIRPYALPLRRPMVTAAGTVRAREGLLVCLGGDGPDGVGEAAPLPGFSDDTLAEARAALEGLRGAELAAICGDPLAAGLPPSAAHALDQAWLDLQARRAGLPVARLLRPGCGLRVPVGRLVAGAEDARAAAAGGAALVKLKVGAEPLELDLERVAAVRAAIGPGIGLRLDANGGWSPAQADAAIARLLPMDIECVEDPTPALADMAALRGRGILIAADAPARSRAGVEAILAAGAADRIVLKPMFVGGLRESLALIERAAGAGVGAFVTTAMDAAVGRWGALHVAAAAGSQVPCGLDTGGWLMADVGPGPEAAAGAMEIPERPGGAAPLALSGTSSAGAPRGARGVREAT